MKHTLPAPGRAALLGILAAALPAQVSSPKGYLNVEGNLWFYLTTRRVQAIDASHVGRDLTIKSLALRRDHSSPTSGRQTLHGLLKLGINGDIHHVTDDMDRNFLLPPTTVFQGTVSWPDWTGGGPGPYPFDVVYPFTSSYVYLGTQGFNLVWDLDLRNNAFFRRYADQAGLAAADWKPSVPSTVGAGCNGFIHQTRFWNTGASAARTGLSMLTSAAALTAARPTQPVFLALDTRSIQVQPTGWCSPLYVQPNLLIPIGRFVRTATYPSYTVHSTLQHLYAVPYARSVEGTTIYSQMISVDNQGIWLSTAWKSTIQQQRALGAPDGLVFQATPQPFPYMGFGVVTRLGL